MKLTWAHFSHSWCRLDPDLWQFRSFCCYSFMWLRTAWPRRGYSRPTACAFCTAPHTSAASFIATIGSPVQQYSGRRSNIRGITTHNKALLRKMNIPETCNMKIVAFYKHQHFVLSNMSWKECLISLSSHLDAMQTPMRSKMTKFCVAVFCNWNSRKSRQAKWPSGCSSAAVCRASVMPDPNPFFLSSIILSGPRQCTQYAWTENTAINTMLLIPWLVPTKNGWYWYD